jgi:AAA domain, putative AbiEii toxin, Type IV TA system
MIPVADKAEERKFDALLNSIMPGNVYFVTGKNGSGKSRFFAYATKEIRQSQMRGRPKTERLLCLSGTMYDKYPPLIYKAKASDWNVVYLGNKVNNNMVSGTAPFRVLCHYMLRHLQAPLLRWSIARALDRLNFEPYVALRFSDRGLETSKAPDILETELVCNLLKPTNDLGLVDRYIGRLASGDIRLSGMRFFRGGKPFGLSDLSSGERQYALAILGFIYCGSERCTFFYDEPENSLHPEWQLSIVKDLAEVAEDLILNATLIIATHSPLIASSVRNGNVYICDLPAGQAWQRADLFGRASDTVLREQFHLYSARSPEVAGIINKCLGLIARNETEDENFKVAQAELHAMKLDFTPDDPLAEIVATILGL